jgi:serine O-acetyltransferase
MFLIILIVLTIVVYITSILFKFEIDAAIERDPAARSRIAVILLYPGVHALICYRAAHYLYGLRLPFIPRLISQLTRFFTAIEIHPGAEIDQGLFIDHGMGVVIGETSVIGKNVTIYQGVTLGGTGKERGKRHPTIGDNVVIGSGAKVLGNIRIGDNVQIGSNAVVIKDVPDDSTVVGVPGRMVKREGVKIAKISLDHRDLPDPLAQSIERIQNEIEDIEGVLKQWRKKKEKELNGD